MEEPKPNLLNRLKRFGNQCRIVLRVTKKPSKFEFKTIVKVSALGIVIIGFIGFVLQILKQLLL